MTQLTSPSSQGGGEREKNQGKNNENFSENEDRISVDNETEREDEMEEEIETETEMHDSDSIRELCMTMLVDLHSMKEEMATRADFEPFKDMANKFETRTEINPTQEDVQPVRTVRVPAYQISDRKFVKIERKQRKRKEQTDCKAA